MAFVVIWQGPGRDTSHCRVFKAQASAEEAADARRADGAVVTVVDTQWGGRSIISSDAPVDDRQAQAMNGAEAGRTH